MRRQRLVPLCLSSESLREKPVSQSPQKYRVMCSAAPRCRECATGTRFWARALQRRACPGRPAALTFELKHCRRVVNIVATTITTASPTAIATTHSVIIYVKDGTNWSREESPNGPLQRSHETNPMGQNCGSPLPAKDCTNHPEHPQTQTPATAREHNTRRPASPAIMLRTGFHETKPMGQNCGSPPPAKDRANQPEHPETQTPATAREHNTRRSTSPAVMPQTGLHNTPLSAKRVSQGARPARDGSRQKSQASELLLLLLLLKPHSFSARPIVAIRLPI